LILNYYNYIFYLSVRTLNWCSINIIVRPLISIMKVLSVSENRIEKVRKSHLQPTSNYDNGTNIHYAFRLMLWSFTCMILILELVIFRLFQSFDFEHNWRVIISIAVFLSITFNYLTLWRSDRYENYFRIFKQKTITKNDFTMAIMYHLTVTTTCFWIAITT
jgi:hypothetical protein